VIALILGRFKPIEDRPLIYGLVFSAIMLAIRLWIAMPFWASGQTKWLLFPFELTASVKFLFANEFMLHLPGGPYPMPFPVVMAWLSGVGEIVLPVLLVLGVLTRPAALGILAMTLVIQTTIPDGWPVHIQWAIAGLLILVFGPGLFSADWLARRFAFERSGKAANI
jgi:putative oxidoreductase